MTSHHGIICLVAAAGLLATAGNAVETKPPASGEVMGTSLQAKAPTQEPPPVQAPKTDPVDAAIARGIKYLMSQQRSTGYIHDVMFLKGPFSKEWQTATTSLSIMAFLAVGHQPGDQTPEGETIRRALAFVLRPDRLDANGNFGTADDSNMYGHGITTLMLAEVLGMGVDADQDKLIHERCKKGVELILRSQKTPKKHPEYVGGWRYSPTAPDSDLSITVWQLMALRASKNAEIEVPSAAIDAAVAFVKRCYAPNASGKAGACAYFPGIPPTAANPAAGLLGLQMCGAYDSPEVAGSVEWVRAHPLNPTDTHFFYWIYYYAQGMYQCGGSLAEEARQRVLKTLLPLQAKDGSWDSGRRVVETSMAIMALSVKYHFLPIHQR